MSMTTLLALQSVSSKHMARNIPQWDTDSGVIGIENRCSACISREAVDFIGELTDSNITIKVFGGTKQYNVKQGTIKWHWEDDQGKVHKFYIPHSYYVPQGKVRLISPHHWSQCQKDTKPTPGTLETTTHDTCTLQWD